MHKSVPYKVHWAPPGQPLSLWLYWGSIYDDPHDQTGQSIAQPKWFLYSFVFSSSVKWKQTKYKAIYVNPDAVINVIIILSGKAGDHRQPRPHICCQQRSTRENVPVSFWSYKPSINWYCWLISINNWLICILKLRKLMDGLRCIDSYTRVCLDRSVRSFWWNYDFAKGMSLMDIGQSPVILWINPFWDVS